MSTRYMAQKNDPKIDWARIGLGQKLDSQVARETGVPRRRVAKIRAKLGIPAFSKTHPNPRSNPARRVDAAQPATKPITQVVAQTPVSAAPVAKPPKAKKPQKVALKNYVAVVLDRSGSISDYRLTDDVIKIYNNIVDDVAAKAKEHDQETVFNLFTFSNAVRHDVQDVEASKVRHLTRSDYMPSGGTALFDAVGTAIEYFKARPDANEPNVSFLVITITDGEENQSRTFRPQNASYSWNSSSGPCPKLNELIYEVQGTDRFTIVFQLPSGYKQKFVDNFKISNDNVREWSQTSSGVKEMGQYTSGGITNFYASRASGQTSVQNFFVQPDLSKVSAKDIKAKLDDVSDHFKSFVLYRELNVKDAMESKTRRPYVVGAVYYELVKPEEVQPQKNVLLVERGKKAVWSGDQARDLIGLPRGSKAKVKPGNHSNYQIFIQSQSVNRILPRGTTIMVDTSKIANDAETWASGYTAS